MPFAELSTSTSLSEWKKNFGFKLALAASGYQISIQLFSSFNGFLQRGEGESEAGPQLKREDSSCRQPAAAAKTSNQRFNRLESPAQLRPWRAQTRHDLGVFLVLSLFEAYFSLINIGFFLRLSFNSFYCSYQPFAGFVCVFLSVAMFPGKSFHAFRFIEAETLLILSSVT